MGYYRAGFDDITGVDIAPQKHYPFKFIQADALEYLAEHGHEYDAIHASPPCQEYTLAGQQWRKGGKKYSDLVGETRNLLQKIGKPYVIENVPGAPLNNPTVLNAAFFGMNVRRTRLFETSFNMPFMLSPKEGSSHFRTGRPPRKDDPIVPVGHFSNISRARRVGVVVQAARDVVERGDYDASMFLLADHNPFTEILGIKVEEGMINRLGRINWKSVKKQAAEYLHE